MYKAKYGYRENIYIPEDFFQQWNSGSVKIEEAVKRKLVRSKPDFIIKAALKEIEELEKRGFFKKGDTTIDSFMSKKPQKHNLDLYSRIPTMDKFMNKGVDGETNPIKIFNNKLDCFEEGYVGFIKMWRNCEAFVRAIESRPDFKDKLEEIERDRLQQQLRDRRIKAMEEEKEYNSKYKNNLNVT